MPLININLNNVHEPKVMPKGLYTLRISDVEVHEKDGKEVGRILTIDFDGIPEAQPIRHWLSFPQYGNEEQNKTTTKERMLKRFLVAFSIPFDESGFNDQDLYGATATLEVTLEEYTDRNEKSQTRNAINLPRLVE